MSDPINVNELIARLSQFAGETEVKVGLGWEGDNEIHYEGIIDVEDHEDAGYVELVLPFLAYGPKEHAAQPSEASKLIADAREWLDRGQASPL